MDVSPSGFRAYPTMVGVGDEGQWHIDRFGRKEMGDLVIRREGWPGKSAQVGKWSLCLKTAKAAFRGRFGRIAFSGATDQ
jgi:hypothetical protein